jgi:hypothetical protein
VALTETERDLDRLEAELKRLEAEYNMFFAGRAPRPPWETRSRVEALVARYDRRPIQNFGQRFRFETLQSRLAVFVDLWDRGLRSREEGRSGPFAQVKTAQPADRAPGDDRVLHVSAIRDPVRDGDKLRALYDSLASARREAGADPVPFDRFTEIVTSQVRRMQGRSAKDVAFRVAVKDGRVMLTAKVLSDGDGGEAS